MEDKGKVALVTGAAQGIGAALATALAKRGDRVVLTDIADPEDTAHEIRKSGGQAMSSCGDITSSPYLEELVREIEREFGPIGILINNAGIFSALRLKSFMAISEDEWDRVMTVNARGPFQCAKAVVPSMERGGGGRILNVSSGTFHYGAAGFMHYVASKGAVIGLTRSMARELADHNITVNCIAPGLTESEGVLRHADFGAARAATLGARAIKRAMVPDDLVGAALFLTSSGSAFVTGQTISVDGGRVLL